MAVTIRLQRSGARNRPFYRVVVADSRRARDGAFIERLGYYDPLPNPEVISIELERAAEWIRKGARPSDAVRTLMLRQEKRLASGSVPTETPKTSRRPAEPMAEVAAEVPAAAAPDAGVETAAEQSAGAAEAPVAAEGGEQPPAELGTRSPAGG